MTDATYIAAHQKLNSDYQDNRSSMADHLVAVQKLQADYLKGRTNATLPVVP